MSEDRTIVVMSGRVDFPSIFSPAVFQGDDPARRKYQLTLVVDKEDEASIKKLKQMMAEAAKAKFNGKIPKNLVSPLKDGDDEDARADYAGCYYFKAKTTRAPGVVGPDNARMDEESCPISSGDNIRISCHSYAYDHSGSKGVSIGLDNIQFVSKGEQFSGGGGGSSDPCSDFEPITVAAGDAAGLGEEDDSDIPF